MTSPDAILLLSPLGNLHGFNNHPGLIVMIPRKRPRTGEADAAASMANREMEISNSTLQMFLGPAQKSWMNGSGVPGNAKFQARGRQDRQMSKLNTNLQNTTPSSHGSPRNPSGPLTAPLECDRSRIDGQPRHRRNSATISTATNVVDLITNVDCPSQTYQATVLPSPAPSEGAAEGRTNNRNSNHSQPTKATDLTDHNPAQTPQTSRTALLERETSQQALPAAETAVTSRSASATPNLEHEKSRELATRHGGIDELERQLEPSGRTSSHDSNPQSPSQLQPRMRAMPTSNANRHPSRNSSIDLSAIPVHQGRIIPPQTLRAGGQSVPMMPASGPQYSVQRTPVHSPLPQPQQTPSNAAEAQDHGFEGFLNKIAVRRSAITPTTRRSHPQSLALENGRLLLLAEACQTKDVPYLCLHQLFCLRGSLGFKFEEMIPQEGKSGFDVIGALLAPNDLLDLDAIHWFANFPLPSPQTNREFIEMYGGIGTILNALSLRWSPFREHYLKNAMAPYVDDLLGTLAMNSKVLQRVAFKSIYRGSWPGLEDGCFDQSVKIFEHSQDQLADWLRTYNNNIPAQIIHAWHNNLMSRYRKLASDHAVHSGLAYSTGTGEPNRSRPTTAVQASTPLNSIAEVIPSHNAPSTPTAMNQPGEAVPSGNAPRHDAVQWQGHIASNPGLQQMQPVAQQLANGRRSSHPVNPAANIHQRRNMGSNLNINLDCPSLYQSLTSGTVRQTTHGVLPSPQTPNHDEDVSHSHGIIRHLYAQNAMPMIPGQQPNLNLPLFPSMPPRQQHSQQHYLLGYPVQQAHLQDAITLPATDNANSSRTQKLFSYLNGLLLEPVQIKSLTQNVRARFSLDANTISRLPQRKKDSAFGGPSKQQLDSNSLLIRVRCVRDKDGRPSESTWAVSDTEWPPSMALLINEKPLQVRRKAEWGKDMAVDITAKVKQGENSVCASFLRNPQTPEKKYCYALAVEILSIGCEAVLRRQVQPLPSSETKQRISKQLKSKDDEIEIVSNDLVVKITDPFSAQLLRTPVRGRSCVHYECFDLDIFLETRKPNQSLPEQFRCPICGNDARPMNLQVDEWFVEVLTKIKEAAQMDAKAIVVNEEVEWRVKEEEIEGESGDGTGARKRAKIEHSVLTSSETAVIELD